MRDWIRIPALFPGLYDTLLATAVKGAPVGAQVCCPGCGSRGTLVFSGRWVDRGHVGLDAAGLCRPEVRRIPLARCAHCGSRSRVLAKDMLPYKGYSPAVCERACLAYLQPEAGGLRAVVNRLGKFGPHASTLHGWLAGLGARALERIEQKGERQWQGVLGSKSWFGWQPTAVLLSETAKRRQVELVGSWSEPFRVSPRRYQSERRREQLEACGRLLRTAAVAFPESPTPLAQWHAWWLRELHVGGWSFPTGLACTSIQLVAEGQARTGPEREPASPVQEVAHAARSPPCAPMAF